jgi:predicted enzyme related to lactoylglutathione lyase
MEALVCQMVEKGISMLDKIETYSYGKFVHCMDPEGNKIELWEPMDG